MRNILIVLALYGAAFAQTNLTTPVRVLPLADHSASGSLGIRNPANTATLHTFDGTGLTLDSTALVTLGTTVKLSSAAATLDADLRFVVLGGGLAGNYVGFKAPATIAANKVWTLPNTDGSANDVLTTDGAGILSWTAGGGGGSSPPFIDTTEIIKGSGDATKRLRFEVDGLTTATTRTITPQNASYTLAGLETAQTFTADQTYAANILRSGTGRAIGTSAAPFNAVSAENLQVVNLATGATWTMRADLISGTFNQFTLTDPVGTDQLHCRGDGSPACLFNWQIESSASISAATFVKAGTKVEADAVGAATAFTNASGTFTVDGNGRIFSTLLGGGGTNECLEATTAGAITVSTGFAPCIPPSRTISTTSPLGGGGDLSANRTLTCTTCLTTAGGQTITGGDTFTGLVNAQEFQGTNPGTGQNFRNNNGTFTVDGNGFTQVNTLQIGTMLGSGTQCLTVVTSGFLSFSPSGTGDCVTIGGTQTITGNKTFSGSSAFSGAVNATGAVTLANTNNQLTGSLFVVGNFYNRSLSSNLINCAGIADGWTGWNTSGQELLMCAGGNRYKVALTAY